MFPLIYPPCQRVSRWPCSLKKKTFPKSTCIRILGFTSNITKHFAAKVSAILIETDHLWRFHRVPNPAARSEGTGPRWRPGSQKGGKDGGVFCLSSAQSSSPDLVRSNSQWTTNKHKTENVWRNPSRHGVQHMGNQTWTISDRFAEDLTLSYSLLLMSDNRNLFQMSAFEGPGRPQRLWCKGVYFGITLVVQIMRTQHEQHLFSFYSKLCLCKTTFEDVAVSKLLQIHSGLCPKNPWLVPKKNPGTARWFARLTAFCRAQQDGHQHS